MACPFFQPSERMNPPGWEIPPRYPLGDAYAGSCRAPNGPAELPEERQASLCNFGYARRQCECFPEGDAPDAVRFSVMGERLVYVYEIEHAPSSHGVLNRIPEDGRVLSAQARAFWEAYQRRKQGPLARARGSV